MRLRTSLVCLLAAAFATAASAQTKISGTLSCDKADPAHSIETGDAENTVMNLARVSCTWPKPMTIAGSTTKDGYSVAASEVRSGKTKEHGLHVGTLANGDKFYVHFQGTGTVKPDHSASATGTWSFEGGTGKLKGITGGGTFKETGNADGTGSAEVVGEYKLP